MHIMTGEATADCSDEALSSCIRNVARPPPFNKDDMEEYCQLVKLSFSQDIYSQL